jgi:hypothetical protein
MGSAPPDNGLWDTGASLLGGRRAVRLRRVVINEWWLSVSGIASLVFGVVLSVAPGAGALARIWLMAGYAVIFGLLLIGLAPQLGGDETTQRAPAAICMVGQRSLLRLQPSG